MEQANHAAQAADGPVSGTWMYSINRGWTWKHVPDGKSSERLPKWPAPMYKFVVPRDAEPADASQPCGWKKSAGEIIGGQPVAGDYYYDDPAARSALSEAVGNAVAADRADKHRDCLEVLRDAGFSVVRTEDAIVVGLVRPKPGIDSPSGGTGGEIEF